VEAFGFLSYSFGQCVSCVLTAIEDRKSRKLLEDEIFTLIFVVQDCFDEDVQIILNKFPPVVQEFYTDQHEKELTRQRNIWIPLFPLLLPSPGNDGETA